MMCLAVPNKEKSFEGKRDRWVGYDTSRYHEVISDYDKLELAKAKLKSERLEKEIEESESATPTPKKPEVSLIEFECLFLKHLCRMCATWNIATEK